MPLLELTNVRKSFREPDGGELPILNIPRFEVAAGEQVALVGRSGCGKTTLLHAIAGITSVDSGTVTLDGVELTRLSEAGRDALRADKLGYVFQTFNLLPGFSALENVMLGMTFGNGRFDAARGRELLERVGLGHRLHHTPGTLSVGEQQRVAVARALANRPKLLLADEPTASVDAKNQQAIIELLKKTCAAEQVAMIIVTHAPEIAAQFDRIVPLEELNLAVQAAISS